MKVRVATPLRSWLTGARLAAAGYCALAVFGLAVLSACSSSGTSSGSPTFSPSISISGSATVTASTSPSSAASATGSASATSTATVTPTPTVTETVTSYPTAAPVTGGGGTAGFQHALILFLGLAAILAGLVSIAYRRHLTRGR